MEKTERNLAIDAIKGLAIMAVALYHFGGGILPYGYLGVDIFFVVGGYLFIASIKKKLEEGKFNYWHFCFRKIIRLWPLVILASIVSVGLGFFLMLPDDYENLAESAIASSVFSNHILQCITTKNYWDVVNLYKPLMHLWYVGVLMHAYIVIPLVFIALIKLTKSRTKGITIGIVGLTLVSLALFLMPQFSTAWKFYYLPFRTFEITTGGLLTIWKPSVTKQIKKIGSVTLSLLLTLLLCARVEMISGSFMLICTVVGTALFIATTEKQETKGFTEKILLAGAAIGKRSYSIYIWHQVIVAFLFYSFFSERNIVTLLVFFLLTVVLSLLSYQFVEVPLGRTIGEKEKEFAVMIITIITSICLCGASLLIYCRAGVVRDVPELDIYKNNIHRGMHAEYCDRPYAWAQDFNDDDRLKVLVLGNSFGRDWANILYEWDTKKQLDISYLYYTDESIRKYTKRIDGADIVFYADGPNFNGVPSLVTEEVAQEKLYVVGNKNYGESNGIIYARRMTDNYFYQTAAVSTELLEENRKMSEQFGEHYISMMSPVMTDGKRVRIFTDDKKFISQDCRHLTKAGAQYYARMLPVASLLKCMEQ